MKNDSKIDSPVFRTFDTASVNYKKTRLEIHDRDIQNILSLIQRSQKPVLLGTAVLWYDLRMNYVISIAEILVDEGKIVQLNPRELREHGLNLIADAYWIPEKLGKRI